MTLLTCRNSLVLGGTCLILIITSMSCSYRNRLKTDEAKLIEKINSDEEKKAKSLEESNSQGKAPRRATGIKFKEERSADRTRPPVSLDILKSRESVKPVKLSQIGCETEYLRLTHPTDTSFLNHGCTLVFTPKYIYVESSGGIACYDRTGRFLQQVCENKETIRTITMIDGLPFVMSSVGSFDLYYGSSGTINALDDKLLYQYNDNPAKTTQLIAFQPDQYLHSLSVGRSDAELPEHLHLGEVVKNFKWTQGYYNLFPLDEQSYGTIPDKLQKQSVHSILAIKDYNGDTTCLFTDYDPIVNYTNTVGRGTESGDKYYLNGQFHYRPRFNDTIFRVELPNKLIPEYVINFGGRGIGSSLEGIDPRFKLTDKFVHSEIIESAENLFIEYTQDYDCPNTMKNGTLKYNRCVYFKRTGDLVHIQRDLGPTPGLANGWPYKMEKLVNDLDKGVNFWPEGITPEGIPYEQFTVDELSKRIRESGVANRELIELANRANPKDLIIMLIKKNDHV